MKREYKVKRPARMRPAHPGAVLRDDVLPALGVSVTAAARELGISRQTLHTILAEKAPVTPEMAVRLGRWCGNGPHLWLAMQRDRDLWDAAAIREVLIHTEGLATRRLSMMRIMAMRTKAAAMRQWRSKSRARRRLRLIQPMLRSTIQRFGSATKRWRSQRRTISMFHAPVRATVAAVFGP